MIKRNKKLFFFIPKIIFIFEPMQELLNWSEKLEKMEPGEQMELTPLDKDQAIYSAIRNHYADSEKEFSIRKSKKLLPGEKIKKRFLLRLK